MRVVKQIVLVASILASTVPAFGEDSSTQTSPLSANKQMVRDWITLVIDKENLSSVDKLAADDIVVEFGPSVKSKASGNHKLVGKEQVKQHIADLHKRKDIESEIVEMVAEGNTVAVYKVNTNKFPSGHSSKHPFVSFYKIKDGKIASILNTFDTLHEHHNRMINQTMLEKKSAHSSATTTASETH